jgi:hypothetical protein
MKHIVIFSVLLIYYSSSVVLGTDGKKFSELMDELKHFKNDNGYPVSNKFIETQFYPCDLSVDDFVILMNEIMHQKKILLYPMVILSK